MTNIPEPQSVAQNVINNALENDRASSNGYNLSLVTGQIAKLETRLLRELLELKHFTGIAISLLGIGVCLLTITLVIKL